MKKVLITKPFEVKVEEADLPEPGPGQILVHTTVTGISAGTEMNLYRGTNPDLVRRRWGEQFVYPMNPGYQCVGVIVACGPDVTELQPGDRVMGNGGHSEYNIEDVSKAIKLPDSLSDEVASLISLGRVSLHGIRRGRIEYGDNVAVVGMGLMGHLAIQHARLAGAGRTIAVDIDPWKLEIAKRLGADHTINPDEQDPEEAIAQYTDGGADAVIETAGVAPAVPLSFKLARYGARVVIVGWHLQSVPIDLAEDVLYKELDLLPSRAGGLGDDVPSHILRWNTKRNSEHVVNVLADGRLNTDGLITHFYPYEDIQQAYEMIHNRSEKYLHVVLRWR